VSSLKSFFARHWKSFLSEIALAFTVVVVAFAVTLWIAIETEKGSEPSDPQRYTVHFDGFDYRLEAERAEQIRQQRYTVHFDGIDYQDLTRDFHGLSRHRSAYKTKAGKCIEFHGNFYEVEQ